MFGLLDLVILRMFDLILYLSFYFFFFFSLIFKRKIINNNHSFVRVVLSNIGFWENIVDLMFARGLQLRNKHTHIGGDGVEGSNTKSQYKLHSKVEVNLKRE